MNAIILPPLWFCTLYCSQNICRTFSDISLLIPKISLRVQRIVPFPYKESSWTVVMSSSLKKKVERCDLMEIQVTSRTFWECV